LWPKTQIKPKKPVRDNEVCGGKIEAPIVALASRLVKADLAFRKQKWDVRQRLWHRHRMVQTRTRMMNQWQAVALNEGLRFKKRLWREAGRPQLESFPLAPWANRRRHDLLELLDRLNPTIAELSQAIEQEVEKCPEAQRLMTHPGVGPLTALAFVLIIGSVDRFQCGKQIASYLGLVPLEKSSGSRRRLGHITKQGNSMLRFLRGGSRPGHGAQHSRMAQPVFYRWRQPNQGRSFGFFPRSCGSRQKPPWQTRRGGHPLPSLH